MAGPNDPTLGFADSAFEEPRQGRTRVFRGNSEAAAHDESPRVAILASQVEELLTRVHELESRMETLEGDLSDDPTEFDDEPPI